VKILAYIPARAGSKGVPNKNVKPIGNVPLLEYTTYTACIAKECGLFQDVLLSTDSIEYLKLVQNYDVEPDYLRPAELATDESATIDGVIHALEWFHSHKLKSFDAVMILQPTTPFRTLQDIRNVIKKMEEEPSATCVTTVVPLRDHHPMRIKIMNEEGRLTNICADYIEPEPSRRQDFRPTAFIRNGAIYLTKVQSIIGKHQIRGDSVWGVTMDEANSINIDEHIDFLMAAVAINYPEYKNQLDFFCPLWEKFKP
jgi:CMP-N,N'-diacetyllegionaminic acid synthase